MPFSFCVLYGIIRNMFGYIAPLTCELKVREHEVYQGYYCGLCKTIRRNYSRTAALFLSNDCTFFYVLFASLADRPAACRKNHCLLHGRAHKSEIADNGADYAAALNVLLTAEKLRDDVRDEHSMRAQILLLLMRRGIRKAQKKYPDAAQAIAGMVEAIHTLEEQHSNSIDQTAHTFAVLLGKLFEHADTEHWEALYDLGYNIGRFIYLLDAYDDVAQDVQKERYNVFYNRFLHDAEAMKESAAFNLKISLAQAREALLRLNPQKNRGILENIITLGLLQKANGVLERETV